jgi:hypothetical protein
VRAVFVLVVPHTLKEVVQPRRCVRAIKLVNDTVTIESNGNAVHLAANINGNVQLVLHDVLPRSGKTKNRLRALPTQEPQQPASSRQALQTMRMTGAAFQA